MVILPNAFYHFYNQGNNKEVLFRERNDYLMFLHKFRQSVSPYCQVICYCLMPNHFHFLLQTTEKSLTPVALGTVNSTALTNGFRLLCSGYANEANKKYARTGSLFRQKTKMKYLEDKGENYPFICFHYIHQNPMKAGLVSKMEDWEFSSFQDYCGARNGSLIHKSPAYNLIGISCESFYSESYHVIVDGNEKGIF